MSANPDSGNEMNDEVSACEEAASERGLVAKFWEFLPDNKKFWLLPIKLILVFSGSLIIFCRSSESEISYNIFLP